MTKKQALKIVLELAEQNIAPNEPDFEEIRKEQTEAIKIVRKLKRPQVYILS